MRLVCLATKRDYKRFERYTLGGKSSSRLASQKTLYSTFRSSQRGTRKSWRFVRTRLNTIDPSVVIILT